MSTKYVAILIVVGALMGFVAGRSDRLGPDVVPRTEYEGAVEAANRNSRDMQKYRDERNRLLVTGNPDAASLPPVAVVATEPCPPSPRTHPDR